MAEKYILDASAGFRMIWFNKQHPNTVYLDERPECEPDIVGDFIVKTENGNICTIEDTFAETCSHMGMKYSEI